MFKGHNFVKLVCGSWVLDLTEFAGYRVKMDKDNNIVDFDMAFNAKLDEQNEVELDKVGSVPVKVLREAKSVIKNYVQLREA